MPDMFEYDTGVNIRPSTRGAVKQATAEGLVYHHSELSERKGLEMTSKNKSVGAMY
jgi:hypothetical protein